MSIRDELNKVNLNRLDEMLGAGVSLGEVLSFLLEKATAIEAAVVPTANVITLANIPSALFQVNVKTGTVTGIVKLRKGVVGTDVPATGECVWQVGTKRISFAAADVVATVDVTYATTTDKCSLLEGSL